MTIRRAVSLMLIVQVLLTQMLQCHCHAAPCDEGRPHAATPHVHVPSLASGHDSHRKGHHHHHHHGHGTHDHGHGSVGAAPGEAGPSLQASHPSHEHDADAVYLPHGLVGDRSSSRPFGELLDGLTPAIPVRLDQPADPSRDCSFAYAPPDTGPPGVPLYLRLLTLLV